MSEELKPTEMDISTLCRCLRLEDHFEAGIFASNGGQANHFLKLVRRGWFKPVGVGYDIDGTTEGEHLIYKLTTRGRKIAESTRHPGGHDED